MKICFYLRLDITREDCSMNIETTAWQVDMKVTLLEEGCEELVLTRTSQPMDEDTRAYLRERALVENMTARRLFADDDL